MKPSDTIAWIVGHVLRSDSLTVTVEASVTGMGSLRTVHDLEHRNHGLGLGLWPWPRRLGFVTCNQCVSGFLVFV